MPCWVGVVVVSMAATLRHITLNRTLPNLPPRILVLFDAFGQEF